MVKRIDDIKFSKGNQAKIYTQNTAEQSFNYNGGRSSELHLMELQRELREALQKNKILEKHISKLAEPPLLVAELKEEYVENNDKRAIIRLNNGNEFAVNFHKDCKEVAAGDSILVDQKNLNVIKKIASTKKFNVEQFLIIDKPDITWENIGGLQNQIREIQEVVELPLKKPELFKKVGIQPPKGVLLYGTPGTGKTLLAKAVANSTNSTFIEIVGSELVQKFIGEGAKMIKEIFELAREKAPAIIFIDEIDALAATRIELGTSGEREVQRTFMQLLAEVDGFNHLDSVKIIGCTNRKDILDPAITRPGRLDRLIHVPNPGLEGIIEIFKIHTKHMKLAKNINLDKIYKKIDGLTGAEIKAVCTESGYFAIRKNKTLITQKDIEDAISKVKKEEALEGEDYMHMFR